MPSLAKRGRRIALTLQPLLHLLRAITAGPCCARTAKKILYQRYAKRVASMHRLPVDPAWDGANPFETQ